MRIINILLRIWAYLPIFSLTDDLGFLTANPGSDQHKYYFSLISILFGEKKYQFMSFPIKQPSERISIFRVKQLSEMDSFILSEEKGNEKGQARDFPAVFSAGCRDPAGFLSDDGIFHRNRQFYVSHPP